MSGWIEENKGIVLALLSMITLAGGFVAYTGQSDPPPIELAAPQPTITPTERIATATPEPTSTPRPVRVYITGEVNNPDVYELPAGSIIKHAIAAAGGPTADADLLIVNQALEVRDQMQITIPAKSAALPTPKVIEGGIAPVNQSANDTNKTGDQSPNSQININAATLEDLTSLTGIGPSIGQRIIDYRTESGPFNSIEDLMNVKGIGSATFDKVKDRIWVGE